MIKISMDKFTVYVLVITAITFIAMVWTLFFLQIKIDAQFRATLVNGITSSISVIIGFCGAIIGIMFRDTEDNSKARNFYLIAITVLIVPLTMLWTTYTFLTMNMSEFAVTYGLSGLIIALYMFFTIVVYTLKITQPKSDVANVPSKPER